ncbi:hypothetical protein BKA65DRAFT_591775 [Rhexocercosporidium sp. MPI-PUGE-AT-0058]|nr:hypothetical protein BKA65DRAFT_591775 [Rhexocercosporidium sp. MPI-PUGE-AT-0058]
MSEPPAKQSITMDFEDMNVFAEKLQAFENNSPAKRMDPETVANENAALEDMGVGNWIGKLTEYRQVHPVDDEGIIWNETDEPGKFGPRFHCTVKIAESDNVFGSGNYGYSSKVATFSSKKTAKKYAAMLAIEWLIQNNHMPNNGTVRFPKPVAHPPNPAAPRAPNDLQPSYASQVPELCIRLGFGVPRYVIAPALDIPNNAFWNGFADFGNDPRIDGRVGEVKNVHGKKAVKEQVARLVLMFLRDIERQRLEEQNAREEEIVEQQEPVEEEVILEEIAEKEIVEGEKAEEDELGSGDEKKRKRASNDASATPNKAIKV